MTTVCFYHVKYVFKANLHSAVVKKSRKSSLETGPILING